MKKIAAIIALLLVVAGSGYFWLNQNPTPEQQVVGEWYDSRHDSTITFNKNKTFEFRNSDDKTRTGKWDINGKFIKIKITGSARGKAKLPSKDDLEFKYLEFRFEPGAEFNTDFSVSNGVFEKQ